MLNIVQRKTKPNTWDAKYSLLKEYVEKYRIPRTIPTDTVVYKDFGLGAWCTRQRRKYRGGKLSVECQEKLEAIKGWFWRQESQLNDPNWYYKLAVLKKFINEYGRLPRSTEVYESKKIGSWCENQRYLYRSNEKDLPAHRIEELNKIPEWRW